MKGWLLLLVAWLTALSIARAADTDRFSQWLTASEQKEIGLGKLSSDQIAVLDALVRRDVANRVTTKSDATAEDFSKHLTADQFRITGLAALTAEEVARVDVLVGRFAGAKLARTLLSPPVYIARSRIVEPKETKKEREIHGSFSLSMGWGSGGYSEKSGAMMLRMDDPEHNLSVSFGYSETHVKGPAGTVYRDGYYPPYYP